MSDSLRPTDSLIGKGSIFFPQILSSLPQSAQKGCGDCRFAISVDCAWDDQRLFCNNDGANRGFLGPDWQICPLFEPRVLAATIEA